MGSAHAPLRVMISEAGPARIAEYAVGIGPEKSLVIPRDANGNLAAPTELVSRAHAAGLKVHPWICLGQRIIFCRTCVPCRSALHRPQDAAEHGDMSAEVRASAAALMACSRMRRIWRALLVA